MPEGQVDTGRVTHLPQMHRDVLWKSPVRATTTANGTLASAFDNASVIDGVTLATDDRILIKNQTATEENGIYVVQASGAPIRTYDLDDPNEASGAMVYVLEGTANGGKLFVCTTLDPIVIGVDGLTFTEFSGGGSALAVENEGTPLTTAATTLDFVGQGVTASGAGAEKTITIPGEDTSYVEVAAAGATETVDCSVARTYDLTLSANLTLTLTGSVNNEAHFVTVAFRQNGTGGWTVTHPGSVVWGSGSAPTIDPDPGAVTWVTYVTFDGGTTWFGFPIGGGTMSHDALDDVSPDDHHDQTHDLLGGDHTFTGLTAGDVLTATSATEAEFLPPSGGSRFEVLLTEDGTEPITTEDGLDWLYVEVTD